MFLQGHTSGLTIGLGWFSYTKAKLWRLSRFEVWISSTAGSSERDTPSEVIGFSAEIKDLSDRDWPNSPRHETRSDKEAGFGVQMQDIDKIDSLRSVSAGIRWKLSRVVCRNRSSIE